MTPTATRNRLNKFTRIARKCRTVEQVMRLWDYADHMDEPEAYWDALATVHPYFFGKD